MTAFLVTAPVQAATVSAKVGPLLNEAKQMIRSFRDQFHQAFESDGGDSVYQLNIQFFEHTKGGEK